MAATFARGAQTVNSVIFKPIARKAYHKKSSSSPEVVRDTAEVEVREVKNKANAGNGDGTPWVPDERTGIYCPKGQEKVLENIAPRAGKDVQVNWRCNE